MLHSYGIFEFVLLLPETVQPNLDKKQTLFSAFLNFFFSNFRSEKGNKDIIFHTNMIHFTSNVLNYRIMYSGVYLNSAVATFHFICGVFKLSLLTKIKEPLLIGFF